MAAFSWSAKLAAVVFTETCNYRRVTPSATTNSGSEERAPSTPLVFPADETRLSQRNEPCPGFMSVHDLVGAQRDFCPNSKMINICRRF